MVVIIQLCQNVYTYALCVGTSQDPQMGNRVDAWKGAWHLTHQGIQIKITMRYHLLEWLRWERPPKSNIGEIVDCYKHSVVQQPLWRLETEHLHRDPAIPLLRRKYMFMKGLAEECLYKAPDWKQLTYPPSENGVNKLLFIYHWATVYHWAIRRMNYWYNHMDGSRKQKKDKPVCGGEVGREGKWLGRAGKLPG